MVGPPGGGHYTLDRGINCMGLCRIRLFLLSAVVLILAAPGAFADEAIQLAVDATRTQQKLLRTHLVLPVKPGPLTLYYPKWIPGEHGPDGRSRILPG